MKHAELGMLAILDRSDEMVHAVQHRTEILVLTLDDV
jgi:hypothetical protein